MAIHFEPTTGLGRAVHALEENAIALILGLMTVITFINVILRYGFGTGILWGLEATAFLFAWLILFGVSYCVKVTAHLGVDALINTFPQDIRRILGLVAAGCCIAYAFLLFKGSWDYWANFANLPQTTGRWFPTGFEEMGRSSFRSWYEVNDIPMPDVLRFIEPLINENEAYEKLPRFIPYVMLPFGTALLLFRFIQATHRIWVGDVDRLIVSHEAEEAVEEAGRKIGQD